MPIKLDETKAALILDHASPEVEHIPTRARAQVVQEWMDSDGEYADMIQQLHDTDVYKFQQLGWQIHHDVHLDEYIMAVVTPVPDWYDGKLDENTRRFIYEWKEKTIDLLDDLRKSTGLRPRIFVAAMLSRDPDFQLDTEESEVVAAVLGFSEKGLQDLVGTADDEVQKATNLYRVMQ